MLRAILYGYEEYVVSRMIVKLCGTYNSAIVHIQVGKEPLVKYICRRGSHAVDLPVVLRIEAGV